MSDKFKLLLKQIHFPQHEEAYNEIKSGSIESVKLFKSKRQWFFVFSFVYFVVFFFVFDIFHCFFHQFLLTSDCFCCMLFSTERHSIWYKDVSME